MSKKQLKRIGTLFAVLTFAVLFFPWICAYGKDVGFYTDMAASGFRLTEFSAWGMCLLILPILLLGIMYSKLGDNAKTLSLLGLYLFGGITFYCAVSMGMKYFEVVLTAYARPQIWLFFHPIFWFFSLLSFYLSCRKANEDANREKRGECHPAEDYIGELFLCSRPYTFVKIKQGKRLAKLNGNISFVTEGGYFAALGQGRECACAEDGDVELFDGKETAGFVMRTRSFGAYGAFYGDYKIPRLKKMRVTTFDDVEKGPAELWLPNGKDFSKIKVSIEPHSPAYIACKTDDNKKPVGNYSGAIVVQKGKIAAVVTDVDAEGKGLICISAVRVAVPLIHMALEQKILESETRNSN